MAAPASWANALVDFYGFIILYFIPIVWTIYIVGTMIFKKDADKDVVFLLLTAAGIMSNLLWGILESVADVTTVYYPLDILMTVIGFSAYWFKKYFRHAHANALLNEQLQKADKLKDQFLANTSHELRTPLHGIMNIAHTVISKEKETLNESSRKDMELLITISRRMSYMLGDLLDAARLKEHRITLRREAVSIQSIFPGAITMLEFMADGKPIRIEMDIAESVPPVMADEKRLLQIIYNLLHNALKYTTEGTVRLSAEVRGDNVVIHVSDTGIGMDEETQARIFLPYEQGAYGISDGRGIGLGLSICKQLVELHGGDLTVSSEMNKGSVFSLNLPIADASLPLKQSALSELEADERLEGLLLPDSYLSNTSSPVAMPPLLQEKKANILAVDDDPVNLNVLSGILSSEPYDIAIANSAHESL
ncbi:Sensor protein TorS [compost metagenome]